MVTTVPTGPLGGVKVVNCGVTRNFWSLVSPPPGVVTFTEPVVAPLGTAAVRYAAEATVKGADVALKETGLSQLATAILGRRSACKMSAIQTAFLPVHHQISGGGSPCKRPLLSSVSVRWLSAGSLRRRVSRHSRM